MLSIPPELQVKFEECLRNKAIPEKTHGSYKKWAFVDTRGQIFILDREVSILWNGIDQQYPFSQTGHVGHRHEQTRPVGGENRLSKKGFILDIGSGSLAFTPKTYIQYSDTKFYLCIMSLHHVVFKLFFLSYYNDDHIANEIQPPPNRNTGLC